MERKFSTPLVELPTFLSTISMVGDDQNLTIQKLTQAERKSPPIYNPARDLFLCVLEGELSFRDAHAQAWRVVDDTERRCAVQVLSASEQFLRNEAPSRVSTLPSMTYLLPNALPLNVAPVRLRHLGPERLLVLHFWQTPLSKWQLSAAAAAVLRTTLLAEQPQYSSCEIDFVSVAFSTFSPRRQFESFNWTKLKPLNEEELIRFWRRFLEAWSLYHRKGPRKLKLRRTTGLFD